MPGGSGGSGPLRLVVIGLAGIVVLVIGAVVGLHAFTGTKASGNEPLTSMVRPGSTGATVVATVDAVPGHSAVYLLGVSGDTTTNPNASVLVLTPCALAGSSATCTFAAPSTEGDVTYVAMTLGGLVSRSITVTSSGGMVGGPLTFAGAAGAKTNGVAAGDLHLSLSPSGPVLPGGAMTGNVTGIPGGASIYLVGTSTNENGQRVIVLLAPCDSGNGSATCKFSAPNYVGPVAFAAHTVGFSDPSNAVEANLIKDPNNLPEVPLAVMLPVVMIAAVLGLTLRRRKWTVL